MTRQMGNVNSLGNETARRTKNRVRQFAGWEGGLPPLERQRRDWLGTIY
jgi:hypothetical protein